MIYIKRTSLLGAFALLILNFPAFSSAQSTISVEAGADNNDGKNYYLSGRHRFETGIQIKAGASKSISIDSFDEELISTSKNIGIQSDPAEILSAGIEKTRSLQVDTLEIDATIITLTMNTVNWNLFVSPARRDVSIETTRLQRTFDFESDGITAGLAYYGWDPVYISFHRSSYDYPDKIAVIRNRINLFTYIFGSSTINQVFALEDQRSTLEIGYFFQDASISLSSSEGRSTLDESISTINTLYLAYNLDHNWSLGVTAGTSEIDIDDTTTRFASLRLNYQW